MRYFCTALFSDPTPFPFAPNLFQSSGSATPLEGCGDADTELQQQGLCPYHELRLQ